MAEWKAVDWMPIETAPTNRTVVWCGRYSDFTKCIVYPMKQYFADGKWLSANDDRPYDPPPTHWAPIDA